MTTLRYFTMGLFSLLFVSCTSYAPRVGASFQPSPDTVVVYGQLKYVDNSGAVGSPSSGYRMALQFTNEATMKPLYIRFSKDEPVSCARIPGGRYTLTGFVATDTSDRVLGGKVFGPEDKIEIQFATVPNSAIYLGDFSGYVKCYTFGALTTIETGLTQVTNNFSATTASFHEKFPNLTSLTAHSAFENTSK